MTTRRLPLRFVLAGTLMAFPAHANSQETTVTPFTATLPAVTNVLPDDGASADAAPIDSPLKPVVFADAIVVPTAGSAPAGQSMSRHRSPASTAARARGTSAGIAGVVRGVRDAASPRRPLDGSGRAFGLRGIQSARGAVLPVAGCDVRVQGGNHDRHDPARGEAAAETPRRRNRIDGRSQRRVRDRRSAQLPPDRPLAALRPKAQLPSYMVALQSSCMWADAT